MQIKSWQIALAGAVIQPLIIVSSLIYLWVSNGGFSSHFMGVSIDFVSIGLHASVVYFAIGGISTLLLYFEKTKIFGAIISIIFGLGIIYITRINPFRQFLFFVLLNTIGFFLIYAGIHYFRKKV